MTELYPESQRRTPRQRLALALARLIAGPQAVALASVSAQVDDSKGWYNLALSDRSNERDAAEMQQIYADALEAWRKNPLAKRVIDTMTDYCLGDGMIPSASGATGRFIDRWWNHPKNLMPLRMVSLSDELARAGDLFITLHRNPVDGLSYVRAIPKDQIIRIETLDNDWETEIAYYESQPTGEPRRWLSPDHPESPQADAVMVHYAVNRVVGALMGESDLSTMLPWMLRYSRLLESRVRLHWALRSFLWIVTVPAAKVREKAEQYASPPEAGSVLVKDDTETWESLNPHLGALDAQADLRSVRQMVDAGSGLPPHWRGEATDVNLATAKAMEHSASRHLRRRQLTLRHIISDLTYITHTRAWQIGKARSKPSREAITVTMADLDRQDNRDLAAAAQDIAGALGQLAQELPTTQSKTLRRRLLQLVFKFAGEPLGDREVETILTETGACPEQRDRDPGPGARVPQEKEGN
jgi:hypothetical protein